MIIATTESVAGYSISDNLGTVIGNTIRLVIWEKISWQGLKPLSAVR